MRRRSASACSGTDRPSTSICPALGSSRPHSMRMVVDLPEPFRPSTPILAPGKNESEMSRRICRLGGTILPTRFMV
ncbi:hypothetical protein G6F60_015282 [Rhizopus arrhizus]|nr:hypothetical protein G6F60_015282 [Rhizopus arrhizus]